jgi:predicted nucleic acid-binding protein
MSIVTWGELAVGFESSAEMDYLFRGARILHLHVQVAWEASRIERELRDQGGKLGENDNWIAATARIWGLRLVSRDEAFARVPNLDIISY